MPAEYLDTIFFVGAVATAILLIAANYVFFRRHGSSPRPGWLRMVSGNALLTLLLFSLVFLSFEIYYRFFFDATDRLMTTKVSQRWYARHWRATTGALETISITAMKNRRGCEESRFSAIRSRQGMECSSKSGSQT
jgi:hypothetical protein